MVSAKSPHILLVCSPGGHLLQLHSLLAPVWRRYSRVWVTLPKADSKSLLKNEKVCWAYGPTNRNLVNAFRNAFLALKVLWREQPTCVVSTGAGVAGPFLLLARLMGKRCIYIESFARKKDLSLTGRLVYPFVTDFLVQSPLLAEKYAKAQYKGTIY